MDKSNVIKMAETVRFRASPVELAAFEEAARLSNLTLSAWIRTSLRAEAESRLGRAGKRPGWVSD